MIVITGDKHIPIDCMPLLEYLKLNPLTKRDYLIITGDIGFMWHKSNKYKRAFEWFKKQEFTTLFVDGNHENFPFLNSFPIQIWNKGKVHMLSENIIHLMRGQVFEIEGKTFFTFGGATSVDKEVRQLGVSWYEEEMPTTAEYEEGLVNLDLHNWKVDYIITHCCSNDVFNEINLGKNMQPMPNTLMNYFDYINNTAMFDKWYFGHLHLEEVVCNEHICLFNSMVELEM